MIAYSMVEAMIRLMTLNSESSGPHVLCSYQEKVPKAWMIGWSMIACMPQPSRCSSVSRLGSRFFTLTKIWVKEQY